MTKRTALAIVVSLLGISLLVLTIASPWKTDFERASESPTKSNSSASNENVVVEVDIAATYLRALYPERRISTVNGAAIPAYIARVRIGNAVSFHLKFGTPEGLEDVERTRAEYELLVQETVKYFERTWGSFVDVRYNIEENIFFSAEVLEEFLREIQAEPKDFTELENRTWPGEPQQVSGGDTPQEAESDGEGGERTQGGGITLPGCDWELSQEQYDTLVAFLANFPCLGDRAIEDFVSCDDCASILICGVYSPEKDEIVICNSCSDPLSTLVHELIHFYDGNCPDEVVPRDCFYSMYTEYRAYFCGNGCGSVSECCHQAWMSSRHHCIHDPLGEKQVFLAECEKRFLGNTPECPIAIQRACNPNGFCSLSEQIVFGGVPPLGCSWKSDCRHRECSADGFCDEMPVPGDDQCDVDSQCKFEACDGRYYCRLRYGQPTGNETLCETHSQCGHSECVDNSCKRVEGPGNNQCENDTECGGDDDIPPKPL